jgi:hypothetical protein
MALEPLPPTVDELLDEFLNAAQRHFQLSVDNLVCAGSRRYLLMMRAVIDDGLRRLEHGDTYKN